MKSSSSTIAILATLLLHAAMIAAVVTGLNVKSDAPAEPVPVVVELLAPPEPVRAPEPVSSPPSSPPPEQKPQEPKAVAKPKPAPKKPPSVASTPKKEPEKTPRKPVPQPEPSVAAAPLSPPPDASATPALPATPPAQTAPSVPSISSAPPPAPARIGVSIPASYAASNRKPVYPTLSRRAQEEGTVVLRVLVKEDGTAGAVEVKTSSGFPLLDESARKTIQTWRFNPATIDGKPIAEWYQLSVPFKLQN